MGLCQLINVLIVEADPGLGGRWAVAIQGPEVAVSHVRTQGDAIARLQHGQIDVIVLNLVLPGESALAVADFAHYRQPNARVIFMTASDVFADGSIFQMSGNASAFLQADMAADDLAAIVQYHATGR
jgi:DNA-binding NtrC family response regulator